MRDKHPTFCMIMEFPSPCGDKLKLDAGWKKIRRTKFPSPCGDGTLPVNKFHDYFTFSPPYGENPLSHGLRRASSPEGGA